VSDEEWGVDAVDVPAYLDRIGFDEEDPYPDLETLRRLHRAHVLAIPFENIDVVLGRGIGLDLTSIQDKLVHRRRGGYCYEHNLLFAAVLERIGYEVTRYAARVVMGDDKVTARSHMASRVSHYGTELLVDVGFGPDGLTEPIAFTDGAVADQDGRMYRVRFDGDDTVLSDRRGVRWFRLYRLGAEPQHLIDYVVSNHYISTHPRSPFTGRLFAGRITPGERLVLNRRQLTRYRPRTEPDVTEVADGDLGDVLRDTLGIALTDDEVGALLQALPTPAV
jgi:N-hydroxyarylamine O-acetyltransferase